jgi:peptide deformylase
MAVREILLLGNPRLYDACEPVEKEELPTLNSTVQDLHDSLMHFREQYGAGRAIAAPQIGVMKRLIYMKTASQWFYKPDSRSEKSGNNDHGTIARVSRIYWLK